MNEQSAHRKATTYPYFEAETSAEVVNARMAPEINPRLRQVITAIVKHLHAAVKEIGPTQDEWLAAIKFLTDTGPHAHRLAAGIHPSFRHAGRLHAGQRDQQSPAERRN
jgi:Catechol dioxygenase N terminus